MANPRYNTQTTNRRGAMNGGRVKKVRGGMIMKIKSMLNKRNKASKKAFKKANKGATADKVNELLKDPKFKEAIEGKKPPKGTKSLGKK